MAKSIAIVGGGAAGFFAAVNLATRLPDADITIYEGSNKVLAKVLISGGGRCNVTNQISDPKELVKHYPRGEEFLKSIFDQFSSADTRAWFEERNVPLKIEADGRVFPESDSSSSIYNCLTSEAKRLGVILKLGFRLTEVNHNGLNWELAFNGSLIHNDILVLCTGSNPAIYKLLEKKSIKIITPVPSLFTFNAKEHKLKELAGISVSNARVHIKQIPGSVQTGPLLVTHWGYSAPCVLRLSAWYARDLAQSNYSFDFMINWNNYDEDKLRASLVSYSTTNPKGKVFSWREHGLPKRLWQYIFEQSELKEYTNWSEIGKKGIKRLITQLCGFQVKIEGKSTFKEEFVTAGGIDLSQLDDKTMRVQNFPHLYAAGEVLNIDGITGGFNFQAAWSESYVIAKAIASV